MSMIQALAMTVAEIPVFLYTTFGQVKTGWVVALPFNHFDSGNTEPLSFGKVGPSLLLPQASGISSLSRVRSTRLVSGGPKPSFHLPTLNVCADQTS